MIRQGAYRAAARRSADCGEIEPPTFRFSGARIAVQARPLASFWQVSVRPLVSICQDIAAALLIAVETHEPCHQEAADNRDQAGASEHDCR